MPLNAGAAPQAVSVPAAQAALAAAAHLAFTGESGRRVAWRTWGEGDRHIVLLHGSAGSWTHFVRNIAPLAQSCCVHVPDLPGNGDSDPVDAAETLPGMARQLAAGLDGIAPDRPDVVLVGFSFGSLVAEEWALQQPDRVRRLVLVRGSFDGTSPGPVAGLVRWKGLPPQEEALAHRSNLAALMFGDASEIDDATVELHAFNSRRSTLRPTTFDSSRTRDALPRHPMPVLGISGELDVLAAGDVWRQQQAFKAARPRDQHEVIRGAGHWVMYEAAEVFNATLARALDRV